MRGLLDALNSEDGQMGLALLAAAGPQAQPMSFGQRLQGAMGQMQAQKDAKEDRALKKLMTQLQMESILEQQAARKDGVMRQQARQGYLGALASGAQFDPATALQYGLGKDELAALTPKPKEPIKLGAGDVLVDPTTFQPKFTAPNKPAEAPSAVREYEFAKQNGFQGSFMDFELAKRKATAPSVTIQNSMGKGLAGEVAPIVADARAKAVAAIDQASSANNIISAIESGNVITGPFANARLTAAQIANAIGIGGKDTMDQLVNTRQTIQGLSQLVLAGRQQMRGQGAITESESKLAERAVSGDITMTAAELKLLANAAQRAAKFQYDGFQGKLGAMKADPQLAPLIPYYSVPEFPSIQPPSVVRQPGASRPLDDILKQYGGY